MLRTKVFTIAFMAAGFSSYAIVPQKIVQTIYFPFNKGATTMTTAQMKHADSIFNAIIPGENMFLTLLSDEDQRLDQLTKAQLSYKRAEALLSYCRAKKYSDKEYYAQITPHNAPSQICTIDLTSASYRYYSRGRAHTGVVFCPLPKIATSNTTVEFNPSVEKEEQKFAFDPKTEAVTTLASGTRIIFPAGSLMFANGAPVTEPVDLKVAEFVEMDAIVMKMMTTTAGGEHLMTGGMWHIDISCQGKPVMMKAGHAYHIQVANNSEVRDMKVFTGEMTNGMLDWKLQNDGSVSTGSMYGDQTGIDINGAALNTETVTNGTVNTSNINNNWNDRNLNVKRNSWNVNAVFNDGMDAPYYADTTTMTKEQLEAYHKQIAENKKRMAEYKAAQEKKQQQMYDLKLNDFGWINCDAFDRSKQTMVDLLVRGDVGEKTTAMLVYPKRRSVLPGYVCDDHKSIKFTSIAADETAMLVVFTETEDKDMVMKFSAMVNPGNQKCVNVNATKGSLKDLQSQMKAQLSDM